MRCVSLEMILIKVSSLYILSKTGFVTATALFGQYQLLFNLFYSLKPVLDLH